MNTKTLRPAIAMIELIFAIVIMGIVLMSAPMLISTATKSGYVAIQQEAINEAASQINMIMGYHWDENDANETYLDPILQVSNGYTDLDEDGTTGRRSGTPRESYRSFIRSDGTDDLNASASISFTSDVETEEDDIDDFEGDSNLTLIETSAAEYVETTTIDINTAISYNTDNVVSDGYNQSSIVYNPFSTSGGTTNIKSITVTLTSTSGLDELEKNIVLRSFSCNIGGYKLEERDF